MPHYYFYITVDDLYPDPQGLELEDQDAARRHAVEIATSHLHEADRVSDHRTVRVLIKNDARETIETVTSALDESGR